MDPRLTNLEVKVAFQDDLLESLNQIVASQQRQLDLLQGEVRMLYEQIRTMQPTLSAMPVEEAPPPHY